MVTIKQLEEEIERIVRESKYKMGMSHIDSRKIKELEAQISQTKEIVKMIEKKSKEYEKHWLDAKRKGDKQAEDIFYNTYSNLQELLAKIRGKNGK